MLAPSAAGLPIAMAASAAFAPSFSDDALPSEWDDFGAAFGLAGAGLTDSALELLGWVLVPVLLMLAAWLAIPYLDWRSASSKPLETHVARTSFQSAPGELVPPAWKAPELTLSVIVPAYNEEYRLPQMLDETFSYLEGRAAASPGRFSYEVIVVDDGSSDATYAAALGSLQRQTAASGGRTTADATGLRQPSGGELRVLRLTANRGKGFAVKVGMMVARGQFLLMADADGATSIRDLERLERALGAQQGGGASQIAFGSRHHLKEEAMAQRAWHRNFLMNAFHVFVWFLVGGSVSDTQCGFKLFRAEVGKQIFASLHIYRWAFDIEVLVLSRLFGWQIAEVPVTWVEMPGSKLNLITGSLTMLRDIVLVKVLYATAIWRPTF